MTRTAWTTLLLTSLAAAPAGVAAQARIPEVKVKGSSPCEVHPETAAETAELWLSAESALKSSTAEDSNPPLLRIQKWRRTLSRSFKLFYERRDTSTVATRQPFGTPPPSNLERAGYIQQMFHTIIFYGPDPDEIITERFLRRHCFRRVSGSGATQGLLGLAFDPLPRQDKADVSGVLWIDPVDGALRFVEYGWTNPPYWADGGKAHGRTDFVRLAGGGWVTQRWYIRMPKLDDAFGGYTEEGGELLAVGSADTETEAVMRFTSIEAAVSGAADTLQRFPLSLLSGFIACATAMAMIDSSGSHRAPRLLAVAVMGLPAFTAARTAAERRRADPGRLWLVYAVLAAVLVALYAVSLGWTDGMAVRRLVQLVLLAHLAVATAPYVGTDHPNGFWQYNRFLLLRYLEASFYTLVLYAGLAIAIGAINKLFGVHIPGETYGHLFALLAFVFHPWFFLAGVPEDFEALDVREDYPLGLKVFSQFVLIPLVTVYLVILTAYLGKVVITRTWPSGWIGYLVSSVSITGVLALLLVHPIRRRGDTPWVNVYARWWFLALLPALVMLLLAISKRIGQYGITEERYFLIVLTFWMMGISLYYGTTASTNIKRIPESLLLFVLLSVVGPWGAYAVSERSQVARLARILALNGMGRPGHITPHRGVVSQDDQGQIGAVFEYLDSMHGTRSVERVLGVPADSASRWAGGSGGDMVARAASRRLGLEYEPWYPGAGNTGFSVDAAGGVNVDLTGFEVARRISFPLEAWITNGTDSLEIGRDTTTGGVLVSRARLPLMTIDLDGPVRSMLAGDSTSGKQGMAVIKPLIVEGTAGGYRVRIVFQNLYGDRAGGVIKVTGGDGLALAAGLRKPQ